MYSLNQQWTISEYREVESLFQCQTLARKKEKPLKKLHLHVKHARMKPKILNSSISWLALGIASWTGMRRTTLLEFSGSPVAIST